jgi:uncharacterized protein YcaQ
MKGETMSSVQLPLELARRMALQAQLLDGRAKLPPGKEGVAQTIEKLGYIQLDTIAVVRRAHHHTLWTRRPDYDPRMLHQLQATDRRIFEYWGHAASYLPISDYRYYLPRQRSYYNPQHKWTRNLIEKHQHLLEPVLERIRAEGPLGSKDFKPPPGTQRGAWWDWKPAKVALEVLFWRGELMITERRNFQRIYDLTERVLPSGVDTHLPKEDELGEFLVRRALSAHGVTQASEIRDHIHAADRDVIERSLADLVQAGDVIHVKIQEHPDADYYALPEMIESASVLEQSPRRVTLLSPFDNLVIQRPRTERLFGFDFKLECYTPAAKRQYGYFSLPVLWGEHLVGRLDPKADRKSKTLIIRGLFFEPEFREFEAFLPTFAAHLVDFARFNRCESVTLERVVPAEMSEPVSHHLKSADL